jgi:DNA-binding XRE family transcriptional regulator
LSIVERLGGFWCCKSTNIFSFRKCFGEKYGFLSLKTIRKQSHFTQKKLAELLGVTLRMIQAYEQGDQDITKAEARTVFALARALGCAAEVILG